MNNSNLKPIIVGEVDWMRNDYISSISIGGTIYPSAEHAYQGLKFSKKEVQQSIANALSARDARKIGRNTPGVRENWEDIKTQVMLTILRKKFRDSVLMDRLMKTGSSPIVMNGYDDFWGTGEDGLGKNTLGTVLENVRFELQLENGVNPEDYDEEEDSKENANNSLSVEILKGTSEIIADACQDLFDGSVALLTLVDSKDFDASFISRRTGVSIEQAEAAVKKLQSWQSAVNTLQDLLGDDSNEDEDEEIDEDDEDEGDADWLD